MHAHAVRINARNQRAPKAVRLPTLNHVAHTIKGSKSGKLLCKIDLQNYYWTIKLPRSWHRVFRGSGKISPMQIYPPSVWFA